MSLDFVKLPNVTMRNLRNLWRHVKQEGACWIWTGAVRNTYPLCGIGPRTYSAHRMFFHVFKTPISDGLTLDHICRNRLCVNPDHLDPCTLKENQDRAKTGYCKRGHPLADPNLYYYNTKIRGRVRRCLTCMRLRGDLATPKVIVQ